MVHVVVENGNIVGVFSSLKKARTFADGHGREQYPRLAPTERPVQVVSKRVV